jgi:hypothetical protein
MNPAPGRMVAFAAIFAVLPLALATSAAPQAPAAAQRLTIVSPAENSTLRLDEPMTLAVSAPATGAPGAQPGPVYAWDLVRVADGRSFPLTPPACSGALPAPCTSILLTFGSVPGVGEGEYWLSVRETPSAAEAQPAPARQAIRVRLSRDALALTGVAPGVVVAGEEKVVLHGAGFPPDAELILLGSFSAARCLSCPRPEFDPLRRGGVRCRAKVAADGSTIEFAVPISLPPGPYEVVVQRGETALGGPVLRVTPRAIERPHSNDPHRVAWPLVSGQTIQGTFVANADPTRAFWDYHLYYFYATAGSKVTAFLRRVDTSKSWLHPDELDPELAVAGPGGYVPEFLHGTDDRPNADFNASLTRAPLQWTGLYVLIAGTSKGSGRYELGFQLDRTPPPPKESRFVMGTGTFGWALKGAPAVVEFFLFDSHGAPFSGAPVRMALTEKAAPQVRIEDLTGRTSPWGFATVTMIPAGAGVNPALWFKADQGDAAYGPELWGHERKAFDVPGRPLLAFWASLNSVTELNPATGELRLGAIQIKREATSSPSGSRLRRW